MPVRFSGTVLSLQGPPVGQLPCPGRTCASTRPPLRALPRLAPAGRSSLRRMIAPSTRCLIMSATRWWRPAFIFDMASAPLPPNNQGRARLAVRRPPSSAFPVQHWAPHGGGGGNLQPVRTVVPPLSRPGAAKKAKTYKSLLTTDQIL